MTLSAGVAKVSRGCYRKPVGDGLKVTAAETKRVANSSTDLSLPPLFLRLTPLCVSFPPPSMFSIFIGELKSRRFPPHISTHLHFARSDIHAWN